MGLKDASKVVLRGAPLLPLGIWPPLAQSGPRLRASAHLHPV